MEGEAHTPAPSPGLQVDPHLDVPGPLDGAGSWEVYLLQNFQHFLLLDQVKKSYFWMKDCS